MHPPFSPRGENPPEGLLAAARLTLAGRARSKRHARRGISVLAHRCGNTIPGPCWGRQSCRCLENQLASSAAGGASLIFPLQTSPSNDTKRGLRPPLCKLPHGAAAGPEVSRFNKHPGMRCYVTTCGISVGGEARCSALGWSWANLRKAGYQPSHPQTCPDGQVWTKSVFLLDRARPAKVSRAAARRPSGGFSPRGENGGCIAHLHRGVTSAPRCGQRDNPKTPENNLPASVILESLDTAFLLHNTDKPGQKFPTFPLSLSVKSYILFVILSSEPQKFPFFSP